MQINRVILPLLAGIFLALCVNGYLLLRPVNGLGAMPEHVELMQKYSFLSPKILQDYQNDILINFLPLRSSIRKETASYTDSIAYYFEYLPSGSSIGINSGAEFASASLIKLPVVMAYYHALERIPEMEDSEVTIQKDDLDDGFGDLYKKGEGYKIKLSEAIRIALEDSDNTAIRIIGRRVPDADFDAVYEGVDIDLKMGDIGTILTAKHYSSVLKALYFSSLLNKDDSQHILTVLTESRFNDKLAAGVPNTIPVAHKIGVLGQELYSDCGIVYAPKRPYLLCMISKSDNKTATERMRKLSQMTYSFVSSVNK